MSERDALPEHYRVRALEQALGIVNLLAEHPDLALPEIAERLGLQTPNAHKLILHLQEAGLVETGAMSKRYRLGAQRLGELTAKALSGTNPWEAFRQSVPRLQEATGMPGLIAVLVGGRAIYVEQFRGPDRALGRAFPAHATALGKALLAEAPEAALAELVLDPWTERTIVDPKALAADLAATRMRGWAIEDGELDLARRSVAVAVRDHRGMAVAAIGVGGFASELSDRRVKKVADLVVAGARRVSEALGGGGLTEVGPPRLEVEVLGAVEPPRAVRPGRSDEVAGGSVNRWQARRRTVTRPVLLLTVQEAAERLAVSPRTVRARIRAGRLAYVQERPGTAVRIPEHALAEYLASFTRPATALPEAPPHAPSRPGRRAAMKTPPAQPAGGGRVTRLWDL